MQTEGQKLPPQQISEFLDIVAQDIAEREHLQSVVSLDALCKVCSYYRVPAQQTALNLYFYLRNGEERQALVHQFREHVRSSEQEFRILSENMGREVTLKRQITTMIQRPVTEWKEDDPALFQGYLFDLQALGWSARYPSPGQVQFERIEVASRSEAVALGYVQE